LPGERGYHRSAGLYGRTMTITILSLVRRG
jgi:hypothetical protein